MTTYAVIRKSDQVEVYRYASESTVEWGGMEFATHDHVVVPDEVVLPPPVPIYEWPAFVFLRRFTQTERLGIRAARKTNPVLDDFFSLLEAATLVHSNDTDMVAGMGYLVYLGLLTPTRRDAILGSA